MADLVSVGECMVELSRREDGFSLAYGGDSFNTAVYASRLGLDVAYLTALGDDPYSDAIAGLARSEGISTRHVPRLPGRVPGLYVIETDERGERRFFYWRGEAPAREVFELPAGAAIAEAMRQARCVYFSGITLSLYSDTGLDAFEAALRAARKAGAKLAFDGNFRPRGWKGDMARARAVIGRFLAEVDFALPTFDDEQALWGDTDPRATIARLNGCGVDEIVVKNGADGAVLSSEAGVETIAVPEPVVPLDTTAAGDSFNAGYLGARLGGATPADAARLGHRLAAIVICHRGAIVPREATKHLTEGLPPPAPGP